MHNKIGLHLFLYVLDETVNFSLESYISFYILLLLLILRFLLKLFTEIPVSGDNARIAFLLENLPTGSILILFCILLLLLLLEWSVDTYRRKKEHRKNEFEILGNLFNW